MYVLYLYTFSLATLLFALCYLASIYCPRTLSPLPKVLLARVLNLQILSIPQLSLQLTSLLFASLVKAIQFITLVNVNTKKQQISSRKKSIELKLNTANFQVPLLIIHDLSFLGLMHFPLELVPKAVPKNHSL